MSGIGPLHGPNQPAPLRGIDKDGGGAGGGGRYTPNRDGREGEQPHDEADISPEAQELARNSARQNGAQGRSDVADTRLAILAELNGFNGVHERHGSRLRATLKPSAQGAVLVIEDPSQGMSLKPFGDKDIYHFAPQEVRTKLEAFEKSAGSVLDRKL